MSPLVSSKPSPADRLRSAARRVGDWWREAPQSRGAHVQHSGGWGSHSNTIARW